MNPYRIYRDEAANALRRQAIAASYGSFVAMPFRDGLRYRSGKVFKTIISAAVDDANSRHQLPRQFAAPKRVDQPRGAVVINEKIVLGILESHIFIGDLTFQNTGVVLETGIALAIKPNMQVVLITQHNPSKLHFDLKSNNVIRYRRGGSVSALADALCSAAEHFEEQVIRYLVDVRKRLSPEAIAALRWFAEIQQENIHYSFIPRVVGQTSPTTMALAASTQRSLSYAPRIYSGLTTRSERLQAAAMRSETMPLSLAGRSLNRYGRRCRGPQEPRSRLRRRLGFFMRARDKIPIRNEMIASACGGLWTCFGRVACRFAGMLNTSRSQRVRSCLRRVLLPALAAEAFRVGLGFESRRKPLAAMQRVNPDNPTAGSSNRPSERLEPYANFFEPVVEEARFHQHFRALLEESRNHDREEFLRWAEGFPDRDGKLAQEFQISFNSVFWEVYLFAVFKAYGFTFDWTHSSPDFLVTSGTNRFTVEAVTANAGTGKPNEWEKTYMENFAELSTDRLNKEAMIRLSNSILAKYRKYMSDYASLPHVQQRPFVLAVGPFEQPFFNHQYNRPIRAVLYDQYVDEPAHMANPERYPGGPPTVRLGFVKKENGSEIELGVFNDGRMREISAIIFSCTGTLGKVSALAPEDVDHFTMVESLWGSEPNGVPIQRVGTPAQIGETITDGLQVYYNPYAINPLPAEIFRRKGVVQEHYDAEANMWIVEEVSRSLFFRLTLSAARRSS